MKKFLFSKPKINYQSIVFLVFLFFNSTVSGQISIASLPQTYSQDFNTLSSTGPTTWSNNIAPLPGWYATTSTLNPNNGSTNSNNVYNCGTTSASDRSLGALSTTTVHNFGVRFKNNSSTTISKLSISFSGEQWRTNSVAQILAFDYQISSSAITSITAGIWTAASALDFTSPNIGVPAAVDGNIAANKVVKSADLVVSIPAGSEIILRWTKTGTSSPLLAVDDFSITASATPTSTITFANLQFPGSQSIAEGGSFDVFGQVYSAGLTDAAGAGAGITAEFGYNSSNTDPSTWGTTWTSATYVDDQGNNDNYKTTLGAGLAPGTYYVATRFKIGSGSWVYGGYNTNTPTAGGIWNGTANVSGILTVNSNKVNWGNFQYPASGTVALGNTYNVYGQVYDPAITPAAGQGAGITAEVGYSLSNSNPNSTTGWAWTAASFNSQQGNNDEYVYNVGSQFSAGGTYYMAYRYKKTGSTEYVYGGTGGIWNNDNATVIVTTPAEINIRQGATPYLTGNTFNFGNVSLGTTSDIVFTIENLGTENLTITNPSTVTGSSYSVTAQPSTNVAGLGSTTFTVRFTPSSTGTQTGSVTIANNDSNEGNYIINFTGTGTPSNDNCSNATVLNVNDAAINGTLLNSSTTPAIDNYKDVWYQFTPNCIGKYTISVAGFTGDVDVAYFTSCGATSPVQSSNTSLNPEVLVTSSSLSSSNTYYIRVRAFNTAAQTSAFTISVNNQMTVFTQPSNIIVSAGATANFASSIPANATGYQWQVSIDNGGNWVNVSTGTGGATNSYTTAATTIAMNGFQYRVIISNGTCNTVTSNAAILTVNPITSSTDMFRSRQTGNWASSTTWESSSDGTLWLSPASLFPTSSAASIEILNGHVIATATTATAKNLTVRSGGVLTINSIITNNGTFEIEDNGTVNFNNGSYSGSGLSTSLWNGIEKFHPNSNFVIQNQASSASDFFIPANADITTNTYSGFAACFGNLIFDSSATATYPVFGSIFSNNLTHKNLIFRSATASTNAIRFTSSNLTTTIGGNLLVELNFARNINITTAAGVTSAITIKGDFVNNSSKNFTLVNAASGNATLNIEGNMTLSGAGTFQLNGTVGAISTTNLKGDLSLNGSSILISTSNSGTTFNFLGTGDGLTDATNQTVDVANAATASNITFNANSGSYIKLINQNFSLGSSSKFNVLSGATLDFGFNGVTALNIIANGSLQTFSNAAGSTLKITSADGITSTASLGNVQTPVAGRTYNAGATYHYIGKSNAAQVALNGADQVTGNGLPSQITGKVIAELETQNTTQDDLILRSSGTTTFGTTGGVNGILEIRKGKVIDEPGSGFRNYNGALDDGETDTQRGDLKMTGGRYVVSGAGTKPALSGVYTLTAGTVEFTGTAATKIRTSTPAKQYFNVDVSGINVETAGKNLVVNNLLKVTTPTAVLTVPEILDDAATPYVVTAKKGIQVTSGGKAIFKNNANLIQDIDAANTGNITMERKANVPTVQYNYWASPVKNQALYSLYPGIAKDRVMVYNSSTDKFTLLTTASNPLSLFGKGYSIKGSSDAAYQPQLTATFVGEPNNETSTGTNTIPLSAAGNNYNLIGNPYPSNLDLLALYGDADNTSKFYSGADEMPTAYFWDNTSNTDLNQVGSAYATYSQNNYALLNLSSGTGTPAPRIGAVKQPNGIVKPGQGFIVRAAETAGNLTFKNNFRTTAVKKGTVDGVYYRSEPESTDRYWLKLTTPTNMNIVIAVGYYASADNTFERFDSTVFSEAASENLYSLSSDAKKLAIQGRKGLFTTEDVVPLGVKTFTPGTQQISLEGKEGSFENQTVYLKDKVLNTITNLSQGPYVFSSVKGIEDNRFEIIYKDNLVLGTDSSQQSEFVVYRDGKSYVIKSSKSLGKIELYDLSGRMILTNNAQGKSFTIDSESLPNGVFIIKVENSGDVKTKKIIK